MRGLGRGPGCAPACVPLWDSLWTVSNLPERFRNGGPEGINLIDGLIWDSRHIHFHFLCPLWSGEVLPAHTPAGYRLSCFTSDRFPPGCLSGIQEAPSRGVQVKEGGFSGPLEDTASTVSQGCRGSQRWVPQKSPRSLQPCSCQSLSGCGPFRVPSSEGSGILTSG